MEVCSSQDLSNRIFSRGSYAMSLLVVLVFAILSTPSVAQFQNLNITDVPTCAVSLSMK